MSKKTSPTDATNVVAETAGLWFLLGLSMDTALRLQTWGMVLRNSDYTPQKVLEEFQYHYSSIDCGQYNQCGLSIFGYHTGLMDITMFSTQFIIQV